MKQQQTVSRDAVVWAAKQTIRQHQEPPSEVRRTGSCARCVEGGGCALLAWALAEVGHAEEPAPPD